MEKEKLSRKAKKKAAKEQSKPVKVLEKKKVEDLTIADVLQMPLYVSNLQNLLDSLKKSRSEARIKAHDERKQLCAHPIDKLSKTDIWQSGNFVIAYANVMDKKLQGYSANERKFIRDVGTEAFNITMKALIENEKKGNPSNGDDKQ